MALMMGVGFVFGAFATAALCYRLYVSCNNMIKMMLHNQNVLCANICWYRWSMPLCYLLPLRCENCLQSYGFMTKRFAMHSNSLLICPCRKKRTTITTFFLFPVFLMNTWSNLHVNVFNHVRCPLWCCPPSLTTTSQFLHSFTITIILRIFTG